jgi:hypothetical protein
MSGWATAARARRPANDNGPNPPCVARATLLRIDVDTDGAASPRSGAMGLRNPLAVRVSMGACSTIADVGSRKTGVGGDRVAPANRRWLNYELVETYLRGQPRLFAPEGTRRARGLGRAAFFPFFFHRQLLRLQGTGWPARIDGADSFRMSAGRARDALGGVCGRAYFRVSDYCVSAWNSLAFTVQGGRGGRAQAVAGRDNAGNGTSFALDAAGELLRHRLRTGKALPAGPRRWGWRKSPTILIMRLRT